MRKTKRVFFCLITLSAISLLSAIALFQLSKMNKELNLWYDIMVNVFGGTVLGSIITFVEYNTAKASCLQDLLIRASQLNSYLQNPPVLYYSDFEYYSSISFGKTNKPWVHNKREIEPDIIDFVKFLERLSKIDITVFDNSYYSLDFIFGNVRLKPWIYKEIYLRISEFYRTASELANYIEVMGITLDNYRLLVKKCMPLVQQWFDINITESDTDKTCTVISKQRGNNEKNFWV